MKKLSKEFNTVSLTCKEVFQIELPAITSAGYAWSLHIAAGEGRLLTVRSHSSKNTGVGAQITQVFTFVADKPGTLVIEALYQRPWEHIIQDKRTFTIAVK